MRGLIGFASGFLIASAVLIGTPLAVSVVAAARLGVMFGLHQLGAQDHTYVCPSGDEGRPEAVVPSVPGAYALTLTCQRDQPVDSTAASDDLEHYFALGETIELLPPWDDRFEEGATSKAYRSNRATAIEVLKLSENLAESDQLVQLRRALADDLVDIDVSDSKWDVLWRIHERKSNGVLRDLMEPDLKVLRDDPRHDRAVVDLAVDMLFPTEAPERLEATGALFGVVNVGSNQTGAAANAAVLLENGSVYISDSEIEIYSAQFNDLDTATAQLMEHLCEIGCTDVDYGYLGEDEDDI